MGATNAIMRRIFPSISSAHLTSEIRAWGRLSFFNGLGNFADLAPWLVSLIMIGHVSTMDLAALGIIEVWLYGFMEVCWTGIGMTQSTLVSQAHGGGSLSAMRGWAFLSLVVMFLCNVVIAILCLTASSALKAFGMDAELVDIGQVYANYIIPALFLEGFNVCASDYLTAFQQAWMPTAIRLVGVLVDVPVSYVYIFGPGKDSAIVQSSPLAGSALGWIASTLVVMILNIAAIANLWGKEMSYGGGEDEEEEEEEEEEEGEEKQKDSQSPRLARLGSGNSAGGGGGGGGGGRGRGECNSSIVARKHSSTGGAGAGFRKNSGVNAVFIEKSLSRVNSGANSPSTATVVASTSTTTAASVNAAASSTTSSTTTMYERLIVHKPSNNRNRNDNNNNNDDVDDEEEGKGARGRGRRRGASGSVEDEGDDDELLLTHKFSLRATLRIFLFSSKRWAMYASLAAPNFITILLQCSVFTVLSFLAANLGAVEIAAHNTNIALLEVAFTFVGGMSAGTSIRVGYHVGRGDIVRARLVTYTSFVVNVVLGCVVALIGYTCRREIASALSNDPAVVEVSVSLSPILWSTFALFAVGDQALGVLEGQGRATEQSVAFLVGCVGITIPLALVSYFHTNFGLLGLWVSMFIGFFVSELLAFVLVVYYSNWKKIAEEAGARNEDASKQEKEDKQEQEKLQRLLEEVQQIRRTESKDAEHERNVFL